MVKSLFPKIVNKMGNDNTIDYLCVLQLGGDVEIEYIFLQTIMVVVVISNDTCSPYRTLLPKTNLQG